MGVNGLWSLFRKKASNTVEIDASCLIYGGNNDNSNENISHFIAKIVKILKLKPSALIFIFDGSAGLHKRREKSKRSLYRVGTIRKLRKKYNLEKIDSVFGKPTTHTTGKRKNIQKEKHIVDTRLNALGFAALNTENECLHLSSSESYSSLESDSDDTEVILKHEFLKHETRNTFSKQTAITFEDFSQLENNREHNFDLISKIDEVDNFKGISIYFKILQLFSIPAYVSAGESDFLIAYIYKCFHFDYIITIDSDYFLHLEDVLIIKNLTNHNVQIYSSSFLESNYNLTREKRIMLAYLSGCDYTDGIYGIGISKALLIINSLYSIHGSENSLMALLTHFKNVNRRNYSKSSNLDCGCFKIDVLNKPYNFPNFFPSSIIFDTFTQIDNRNPSQMKFIDLILTEKDRNDFSIDIKGLENLLSSICLPKNEIMKVINSLYE